MNRNRLQPLVRKFHISIAGALTAGLLSISIRALVSGLSVPLGVLSIQFTNFLLIRKFHFEIYPLTFPNDIFWTIPIENIVAGVALIVISLGVGITFVRSCSVEPRRTD